MEDIINLLKENYQYCLIFFGVIVTLGAILNWSWIVRTQSPMKKSLFVDIVYGLFGEKGYRVIIGLLGIVLIACGIIFLIYGG